MPFVAYSVVDCEAADANKGIAPATSRCKGLLANLAVTP
jgi:hypothetical protein